MNKLFRLSCSIFRWSFTYFLISSFSSSSLHNSSCFKYLTTNFRKEENSNHFSNSDVLLLSSILKAYSILSAMSFKSLTSSNSSFKSESNFLYLAIFWNNHSIKEIELFVKHLLKALFRKIIFLAKFYFEYYLKLHIH